MKLMNKILSSLAIAALTFAPLAANAQVLDPMSKSGFNTVTGQIFYANGVPVVTGTGTPTIRAGSSNNAGAVTAGTSATSVVITFATNSPWNGIPFCQVESLTQLAAFSYTVTNLAITITQTATSGNIIVYECNPSS